MKTYRLYVLALALLFGGSATGCASLGEKATIIGNGFVKAAGQVVSGFTVFTNLPITAQVHEITNAREDCTLYVSTDGPFLYLQSDEPVVIGPGELGMVKFPNYSRGAVQASLLVEARDCEGRILWAKGDSFDVYRGDDRVFQQIVGPNTF